jgi:hypothetical protein
MPVTYDGSGLVPAPLVSIARRSIFDDGGEFLQNEYTITLTGTIVKVGGDSGMSNIRTAQNALKQKLQSYKRLDISSPTGQAVPFIAYPRVDTVTFDSGVWVNRSDYTIVMTAHAVSGIEDAPSGIESSSENWNVAETPNGVYSVSHSVRATGTTYYTSQGVKVSGINNAKTWVRSRLCSISDSGVLSLGAQSYDPFEEDYVTSGVENFWNRSLSEGGDAANNSWEANETLIYYPSSGGYREEWSVSTQEEFASSLGNSSIIVQGTVFGLAGQENNFQQRFDKARVGLAAIVPSAFTRAVEYAPSGYSVFPDPIASSTVLNPIEGTANYSYTYRASLGSLMSGAIEEDFDVVDIGSNDIFAEISVPGRADGPVIQYMGTKTLPQRSVSYNAVFSSSRLTGTLGASSIRERYLDKPNVDHLFLPLVPSGSANWYITSHQESWSPVRRAYTRNITWTIQPEGTAFSGELDAATGLSNPDLGT